MDEDKQGIYSSWVLAGILVVLSMVLLGIAGPGGMVGALADNSSELSQDGLGGDEPSSDSSTEPSEQSSSPPPDQNAQEEDVSASGGGSSAGNSGGEGLSAVCETLADREGADISAEQTNTAEESAGEFVEVVYGYTGTDADAYENSVEEMRVEECFSESSAAEDVAEASEVARQGGEESAPSDWNFLEEFVGLYVNGEEKVESGSGEYLVLYGEAVWVSRQVGAEDTTGEDTFNAFEESLILAKEEGGEGEWQIVEGGGALDYTDGYYADAVDETIQELQNNANDADETTAAEST